MNSSSPEASTIAKPHLLVVPLDESGFPPTVFCAHNVEKYDLVVVVGEPSATAAPERVLPNAGL
jgi:hypothetical protein